MIVYIVVVRPEDDYPEISARTPSVLESDAGGEYNQSHADTLRSSALAANRYTNYLYSTASGSPSLLLTIYITTFIAKNSWTRD